MIIQEESVHEPDSEKTPCTDFLNYAPDPRYPSHTPTRYIRVNAHIMSNESGDNNFDLKGGLEYIKVLISKINSSLKNNRKMTLPEGNNTPVLPIKCQLVLINKPGNPQEPAIYIHYDDKLAYSVKSGKHKNNLSRKMFDKYGTQKGEVLNIFLVEHHKDSIASPTYFSSVDGVGYKEWIKVIGAYQHLYEEVKMEDGSTKKEGPHLNPGIFRHELGHTLGLTHTWNMNDGCDDTPRNPGCWDQNAKPCRQSGVYSNNVMDYNNCQCAFSPCQIAKIQYNFSRENSSQRKLLLPVWCEYKADSTIYIGALDNVIWNSAKDLEGDIVINNGGMLTIQCEVSLPKGAKIIIKPKGTLVLDGGVVTNKCGDQWEGIEIWSTMKNRGSVIFSNNPSLENMKHALVAQH